MSLGQLPESGEMVFQALQTYSSGEKVNWNQVSADESAEPEHPAPTLSIAAAVHSLPGTREAGDTDAQPAQAATAAASTDDGSDSTLALAMSGAALVVSLITALIVWRGRPAPPPRGRADAHARGRTGLTAEGDATGAHRPRRRRGQENAMGH